ncbi:polyphosphate kinase 1 [Oscillospiraceae bacterium 44-5]|jgi:polyphosphate kinase|uniref:polyphosphate kinase 1 n=1 Tax=Lawsonibacter sp. JLR.KK007 TaxID=3114293 RepID=UPI002FEFD2B0
MKDSNTAPVSGGAQGYVNRELSWLQFNRRVLEEAEDPANPLCERLNFASIFQSNLDEFYMVRVGMLMDTLHLTAVDDKTGMTSAEQTAAVLDRTRELMAGRDRICKSLLSELAGQGVEICRFHSLSDKQQSFLEKHFTSNVLPLLSPQIIGRKQPFPFLRNKAIYAVAILKTKSGSERMGIVPCGGGVLRRLVPLSGDGQRFVLVEDLIASFLPQIFTHYKVEGTVLIRLVRSADIHMDERSSEMSELLAEEYRKSMEKLIRRRKRLQPVKLEYQGKLSDTVRDALCACLGLSKKHLFSCEPPLDLSFMGALRDMLRDRPQLFYPRRVPQNSPNVDPLVPMTKQIRKRDLMLTYPYESVRPLLRLLQEAGQDPEVVSIKMTLYRVAHNSKIVEALVDAAENGKEVVALVELRARFDEENNIGWSRVLEQAGCRVIYGLDGLKVHSKLLLITRMHHDQVEYITQIGTGNYNEDTVRLYTDFALMTADPGIGAEAAQVFNCLSMGEVVEDSRRLMVAPACLRGKVLAFIDREIEQAKQGRPAYLGFKLNGLTDKLILDQLIRASQAGVKIDLIIRGICCLVGGVPGLTENITVRSIVGRYLEHARIYIFGAEERRQVYISSADFMTRNTTRRVEVAVPVQDRALREHVEAMFRDQLRDTAKGRVQQPDGTYVRAQGEAFNSQEYFCQQAYAGAWALSQPRQEAPKLPAAPKADKVRPASAKPAPKQAPAPVRKTRRTLLGRIIGRD